MLAFTDAGDHAASYENSLSSYLPEWKTDCADAHGLRFDAERSMALAFKGHAPGVLDGSGALVWFGVQL